MLQSACPLAINYSTGFVISACHSHKSPHPAAVLCPRPSRSAIHLYRTTPNLANTALIKAFYVIQSGCWSGRAVTYTYLGYPVTISNLPRAMQGAREGYTPHKDMIYVHVQRGGGKLIDRAQSGMV